MIKRLLPLNTLFILLIISNTAIGQNVNITWGNNIPSQKRSKYSLLHEASDKSILIQHTDKKRRMFLEKYSNDGYSLVSSNQIDLTLIKNSNKKSDRLSFEKIYVMKDAVFVFASNYNKEVDLFSIYAKIYDFDGNELSNWKKLESVSASSSRRRGEYDVEISHDKTKLLIKHTVYTKRKELEERYSYSVFDLELIQIFKKEVKIKKESKKDDVSTFGEKVSNSGSVFFFSRFNDEITLYRLSESDANETDADDLIKYKLDFDKKDILDIANFVRESDNSVIVTGFYSDKNNKKNYGISGVVYVVMDDKSLEETLSKTSSFSEEFLKNYISSKRIRKGKGISTSFDLRSLIIKNNGDAVLIAENRYVTKHCTRDQKTGHETCTYTYHFDQLMVIGISGDGVLTFATNLDKYAGVGNSLSEIVSYSVLPTNDGVIIFYNGHYKDFREGDKKTRSFPGYKKGVLVKAFISNTGEISKEAIVRHKEAKLIVYPRYALTTSDKRGVIMLCNYKRNMKVGRFEVE